MAGSGEGAGVGIVTVLIPRSLARHSAKTAVAEEMVPAHQVIAAELIDHDEDRKTHPGRWLVLVLGGCVRDTSHTEQKTGPQCDQSTSLSGSHATLSFLPLSSGEPVSHANRHHS